MCTRRSAPTLADPRSKSASREPSRAPCREAVDHRSWSRGSVEVLQLDDPLEAGLQVAILFEHPVILVADGLLDSDDLAADFVVEFGGVGISRPVGEHRLRPAPLLPGPGHSDDFDPCTWHWRWPPSWPPSTPSHAPPDSPIWDAASISPSAPSGAVRAIRASPTRSTGTPRGSGTERRPPKPHPGSRSGSRRRAR